MIPFYEEIEKHFEEWYPKEGCGLLAVVKGELQWFPCDNVATDEEDFIIDSKQYIEVSRKGDILAVVHSHPDASPEPSIMDINYCNATGLKYYIFSYPQMEMYELDPVKKEKALTGRIYKFGVNDCYSLVQDYYEQKGIPMGNRPLFEDDWWLKGLNYFTDEYIATWGFNKVDTPQKGDLLVFSVYSDIPNHCGVYLGEEIFLHHAEHKLSTRESIFPFWKKFITGVYRYAN